MRLLFMKLVSILKPIITKIFPITFLRQIKSDFSKNSQNKLNVLYKEPFLSKKFPQGINLIGNITGETGLGQSCRLIATVLEASDYPLSIYNYVPISTLRQKDDGWIKKISNTTPFGVNLIHINPHDLVLAYLQIDKESWKNRYNIGFWLWELEEFPEDWLPSLNLVDEIWSPSYFSTIAIRKVTNKPIRVIPYAISAPTDEKFGRSYFSLPDKQFLYLSMYDCNSTMERKNPMGTIHAYKLAFPNENPNIGLVIKVNNPQKKDLDILHEKLKDYKNIHIITDILTKEEVNSLIKTVDVFVSLHRSEGFGLPPAEAMLLGTPVIATNWSSTTEFMTYETACLVDFDFISIKKPIGAYQVGSRWADPNILQASLYMQKLYNDPLFYTEISEKAIHHIQTVLSLEQAKKKVNKRISEIYKQHNK